MDEMPAVQTSRITNWNSFGSELNWITFTNQSIQHYMKILNVLLVTALISAEAVFVNAYAQRIPSRPAPTGKIPSSGTGQTARPYSEYQPKPTGQIQGAVQAADPGAVSVPVPVTQEGQVPKVNTSQDPLTMPERYQPAGQPVQQVTEFEQTTTGTPQQAGSNLQVETNVQTQRSTSTTQPTSTTTQTSTTQPVVTQPGVQSTTTNRTTTVPANQPATAPRNAPTTTIP